MGKVHVAVNGVNDLVISPGAAEYLLSVLIHLYYCSQGLKRSELLYTGQLTREIEEDYSNEYVKIKTVKSFDEAIAYFVDG